MTVTFIVCFEDIDYESWAAACGLQVESLEPRRDKAFDLTVTGTHDRVDQFANELGFGPEKTFA